MTPPDAHKNQPSLTGSDSATDEQTPPTGGDPAADEETEHTTETEASTEGFAPGDPDVGAGLFETDMGPSSALAHVYRGEIHRMKFWRERLDRTTNWAVVVLAAVLTWAFSGSSNPHYLLLVGLVALGTFLGVEARRYRGYDIWRSRVRTLQRNVVAVGFDPDRDPEPDWRDRLAADYHHPTLKVSTEEALAHRLRRIYLPLATVLLAAWVVRVTAFSQTAWPASAAVGSVPGIAVTAVVAAVYAGAIVVACRPRTWHARGELRDEDLRKHD